MTEEPIDYEALPYSSMPFPQTQPPHLAALAAMHGHAAPPVERARVLELGCASGGNLIPLAVRFPDAVFEGVDLSLRHAQEGMALVRALGLTNIDIRQGDIAALALPSQPFDYIICHGVFSWVPKAVQEAIYRLCAEGLSEGGVAYVSYNVLPGWHFQLIVREMGRRYAGSGGSPQAQIARARAALHQLAQLSDEQSGFGRVLREEVERSTRMNDTHFQGEFLSAFNEPCHFQDFVARAEGHGLAYLCDAALAEGAVDALDAERQQALRAIAGDGALALEQCLDFVSGRTFRRSLLVKGGAAGARAHGFGSGSLALLHFGCPFSLERGADGVFVLRRDQAQLKTHDPAVGAALQLLAAAYPETSSFAEIVAHVGRQLRQPPATFTARVSDALRRSVASGHLTASSRPVRVGPADAERPTLWPLAQAQLRAGQAWVSNLLHLPIQMPPAARFVAGLLDGAHSPAQITAQLDAALSRGELVVEGLAPSADPAARRRDAGRLLRSMLLGFRRSALLSPGAARGPA